MLVNAVGANSLYLVSEKTVIFFRLFFTAIKLICNFSYLACFSIILQ